MAALSIVSHPVPRRVGQRLVLHELTEGRSVALSRNEPDFMHPHGGLAEPLADPFLSRNPVVLSAGPAGSLCLEAPEGSKISIAGEPLRGSRVLSAVEVATGVPLELAERVVVLLHLAAPQARASAEALDMVGNSLGLQRVRNDIEHVADLDVPVLIRGETGSGKELIAKALYRRSPRRDRPFISVNLGALPKELAAAELFGAVKGAYSGAVRDREGLFRAAHGGTLFLDEVGEASPEVQVMLLRVLEEREMFPVGSSTAVPTDVRLVTATDAHLEKLIQEGRFKGPLLHRLAGYEIRVPPLRERREDIGPLFLHFAREELEAIGETHRLSNPEGWSEPWLPASLASWLVRYPWPGNIRQLRNLTRQIIISNRGQPGGLRLDPRLEQELAPPPAPPRVSPPVEPPAPEPKSTLQHKVSDFSEQELSAALEACGWEIKSAATRLGVARSSLQEWYQRHVNPTLSAEEFSRTYEECQGDMDSMVQRLRMSRWAIVRRLRELGLQRP
ncbi:sigma 54-interacting transcriptional regulator [Hyalangium gracile]|uniref:sigma 54-interacting transcriptional regulator n=1 Tax=Hyalangium gracile TaxID=394092 RepID=UPI001CCA744A|nr:sigma 54-interacting transcriptional regulator [Hyalangium gracile]